MAVETNGANDGDKIVGRLVKFNLQGYFKLMDCLLLQLQQETSFSNKPKFLGFSVER